MINFDPDVFAAATQSDEMLLLQQREGLPAHYLDDLQKHVTPLAAALHHKIQCSGQPVLLGLNGCQGSGKSTLARFLVRMLHIGAKTKCLVISIDDFYLKKSERQQLARDVHPLLITRGVPGTHDLLLAETTLSALLDPDRTTDLPLPVFSKADDDRCPANQWPAAIPAIDLVIFEGWCVGCPPQDQASLDNPVNELERNEDSDKVWRTYVNTALSNEYQHLFRRLDLLVTLTAPSFDSVYSWRRQQERQLAESVTGQPEASALLLGQELQRFIQHFERLTRHQLHTLPGLADGNITLGKDHRMVAHSGRVFS